MNHSHPFLYCWRAFHSRGRWGAGLVAFLWLVGLLSPVTSHAQAKYEILQFVRESDNPSAYGDLYRAYSCVCPGEEPQTCYNCSSRSPACPGQTVGDCSLESKTQCLGAGSYNIRNKPRTTYVSSIDACPGDQEWACRRDADCSTCGKCVGNTVTLSLGGGSATVLKGEGTHCEYPPEVCGDKFDNNCNGAVDEGCAVVGSDGGTDGGSSCGEELCGDDVDNDCDGEVNEDCAPVEPDGGAPPSCSGPKCRCDGTNLFDPVNIVTGTSYERIKDVEVFDEVATLSFERTFSSRGDEWVHDSPLVGVPKPFGASPGNAGSVEWWHNWLSLVVEHQQHWSVRDRDGRLLRFTPCAGVPCQASLTEGTPSHHERLWRTASGYELVQADGSRLVFEGRFVAAPGGRNRYFLSRVVSSTGVDQALLTYAVPPVGGCPQGASGSSPGVPYLSSVRTAAGRMFSLSYRALRRADGALECVITAVNLGGAASDGGIGEPEVQYTYAGNGDERPGRIANARYRYRLDEYLYTSGEFRRSQMGVELVRHTYGADRRVGSVEAEGHAVSISWDPTVGSCQLGSNCCGRVPQVRQATDYGVGRGDGTEGSAFLTSTYETLSNYGQQMAPRLYQTTESCTPGEACSPGSERTEWACSSAGTPGHEAARKDKRDNWEVYGYSLPTDTQPRLERTRVKRGASDMLGTGALEEQTFSYTYGSNGEQLPRTIEERSVLGGSGEHRRTLNVYEAGSNRRKAVIERGWTRERASDGSWTTKPRLVGTFSFTSHVSLGVTTPDPLGRTMEVHGPCIVTREDATDCELSDYPLTRYSYHANSSTVGVHQRNRLASVEVYPTRTTTKPLKTLFSEYDKRGHVTKTTEPNGVLTTLTYEEDRLTEKEVGGQPSTYYFYADGQHLTAVQYPSKSVEVFCYRKGTGETCHGGTLTDKVQWKAKAALQDGTGWTERVVYAYWPDGTLKEERYLSKTGTTVETRRVLKYAADAHRRPTWQKWGEGVGSFSSAKSFDGADNLTGLGLPFNDPPAWCGGVRRGVSPELDGTPLSQLCSSMAYDRANRLVQVDEYPAEGVAQRTLFQYDAQGNVSGVKTGCGATDSFDTCVQPAATYTYDDFGKVVEVSLPHADGPVRYAYDALGNVVVKETEAMRQAGEYLAFTYDMLSRLKTAERRYSRPSTGIDVLYRLVYDADGGAIPRGCPSPLNTLGRVRYREDSFGKTWYQYDEEGRVVLESGVRAGTLACGSAANANLTTAYSYTSSGNLASVTYPNGRKVTYTYGTGGNEDRVAAIEMTLHDGTNWTTKPLLLLSDVTWEPYGGLRGYTMNHLTTNTVSRVEYALGDNGSVAPAGCSTAMPSAAGSDLTGRLRSLRVTSPMESGGSKNIYQRTYTWKADQVVRTDTCLLGETTPKTETYSYDRTLRLTGASRPAGNFDATGGAFGSRTYGYDGRGNRTSMSSDGVAYDLSYAASPRGDRLTGWSSSTTGSLLGYSLAYDVDGRVTRKEGARKMDGQPTHVMSFAYGPSVGVATETVFRAVNVNGGFYNYYYDAKGRRRAKVYPGGASDEYFHDVRDQLLVDRGSSGTTPPVAHYTQDDYVWLDGRPVAMVRGKLSNTWTRLSDTSEDCSRNGEVAACGVYFPVTDHIGKPVLMLDGSGRVAGTADYDPFGQVNRVALNAETEHPLNTTGSASTLAELRQPTDSSVTVKMRTLFHLLDTKGVGHVELIDGDNGTRLVGPYDRTGQGAVWSDWAQPSMGRIKVSLARYGTAGASSASGVVLEGYEYQRYQAGAQPFWTPLRFPGQYYDAETDLFENWNRYYDPSIGRYLQAEPLAAESLYLIKMARQGHGVFAYSYAGSNSIAFVDPDGRSPIFVAIGVGLAGYAGYSYWKGKKLAEDTLFDAERSGLPGLHNGVADAYRHCLWNCRMTRQIGGYPAWFIGLGHEFIDNRGGPEDERKMDLNNNLCGRTLGVMSLETCEKACRDAALSDDLTTITPANDPPYQRY